MLPDEMKEVLLGNKQCCLGTVDGQEPYLSLMFYTFLDEEGVLVMSSRGDSQKVRNLRSNMQAAVLVHEGEQLDNPHSLTLMGTIAILSGESAEKYRALHLQAHPRRSQFITGANTAILVFTPQKAVMSDRQDQVTYWQK